MKKLSLFVFMALAIVASAAQTSWPFTATYDFSGATGNTGSLPYNGDQYTGIEMGILERVGVSPAPPEHCDGNFRAINWPTGATYSPGKYISFTIEAQSGYKFTVNSITFGIGRDGNGTTYTEWAGSADSYMWPLSGYTHLASGITELGGTSAGTLTNPNTAGGWTGNVLSLGTAYQNITTSCGFRMYMYGAQTNAGGAGLEGPITISGTYSFTGTSPAIEVSTTQLSNITYQQCVGPSAAQSFTVTAAGLTGGHSVQFDSPPGYELSLQENGTYHSGTFFVPSDGSGYLAPTNVYVRLRQGLYAGTYGGNVIVGYYIPTPPIQRYIAVAGTVTPAPEYYVAFEKSYEVLGNYSAMSTPVRLGVNELNGTLNEGFYWDMTQARIGSDMSYVINGERSARLRGYGTTAMTMTEDKPNGAGLVEFKYRRYADDPQVEWKVEYKVGQDDWKLVGQPFTAIQPPAPSQIQTFSGYINTSRPVRIRILRSTPDSSTNERQLNIDCIRVLHYYDFPNEVLRTVNNNQIKVSGGNVNYNYSGTVSDIPNGENFTPSFHRCLTLLGSNPITFTVTNASANYVAYKQGDSWQAFELTAANNYSATFTISGSAKNTDIELLTGTGQDPTLPVTLSHFSATMTAQNYVQLVWISQTETNLLGYNVFRNDSPELSSAVKISNMIEGTNTSTPQTYVYIDMDLNQDGTYYYWLQNVDLDGTSLYHGPVSVVFNTGGQGGSPGIPNATRLKNAYPNPFNPSTTISYQLKDAGRVKIDIYNTKGQILRSFEQVHTIAGNYHILWDGCDGTGKALSSGVYIYKMTCGSYSATKKVVLQK